MPAEHQEDPLAQLDRRAADPERAHAVGEPGVALLAARSGDELVGDDRDHRRLEVGGLGRDGVVGVVAVPVGGGERGGALGDHVSLAAGLAGVGLVVPGRAGVWTRGRARCRPAWCCPSPKSGERSSASGDEERRERAGEERPRRPRPPSRRRPPARARSRASGWRTRGRRATSEPGTIVPGSMPATSMGRDVDGRERRRGQRGDRGRGDARSR